MTADTDNDLTREPITAYEPARRGGSIVLVLLVAGGIVAVAIALMTIGRAQAQPYILGLLAVLAMVGLYSLGAYAVSRRTREIGIRMAIGASRLAVLQMTLRQGLTPALYGVAAGLIASVFSEKMLRAVFPAHTRTDIAAYLWVVPALLAITMLAAFIPARRASRVDPMTALRYE